MQRRQHSFIDLTVNQQQSNNEVIGLGTILVDHHVLLSRFPDIDTKNPISDDRYQVGGPVPTALAMVRRLGKSCQFIGKWSNDAHGQLISEDLAEHDIGIRSAIIREKGRTGFAHVWIDNSNGSRTVAYSRGSLGEVLVDEISHCDFSNCRVLHLDGWSGTAAIYAAGQARAAGATVVLDAGSPKPATSSLIPFVDVINCPARFAFEFFGVDDQQEAARRLLDLGIESAVFTNGSSGATFYSENQTIHQPAFKVVARDTNGAGDVFCGGLIYGILQSYSADKTIEFAAACAAIKCQAVGNRETLPTIESVEEFIGQSS